MSTNAGIWPLGYTEAGSNDPGLLGREWTVMDDQTTTADGLLIKRTPRPVTVRWVKNTSGGVLVPGTIVKRDASNNIETDVTGASSGDTGCGVVDPRLTASVPIGNKFLIVVKGITLVKVVSNYSKGITIGVGSSSRAATNDKSTAALLATAFGVLVDASSAANELVRADVDFRTF